MTHLIALQQAEYFHTHRATLNRQAKADAAVALTEWGVFSNRQIATLLDMPKRDVNALSNKVDATGGTLNPAAIPAIIELIHLEARSEVDFTAVKRAREAGVSLDMLARLTGRSKTTLARHEKRAA